MGYEKPQNVRIPKIRGWNVRNFLESHDELVGADDQIWGPETRSFDELNPKQFDTFYLLEHLFFISFENGQGQLNNVYLHLRRF